MSKTAFVLMLLRAVAISLVAGGVSEAGQCHDVRADITRVFDPFTTPGFAGGISSGLLRGFYSRGAGTTTAPTLAAARLFPTQRPS